MIYLMRHHCPRCGSEPRFRNSVRLGITAQPKERDLPWVGDRDGYSPVRFDMCVNGHLYNLRPYSDYDEHYVYEDLATNLIAETEARLADLKAAVVPPLEGQ